MTVRMEPGRRRSATLLAAGMVASLVLGAGAFWRLTRNKEKSPDSPGRATTVPSPDPRLSYGGPFKNVHPDVQYVGDLACAKCHKRETEAYSRHPMYRTLMPIKSAPAHPLDATVRNPFEAFGRQFSVEERDGGSWHRQVLRDRSGKVLFEHEIEAQYVIGSGARGHSYLTTRNGFVLQTPVTWYPQKNIWDLSPGFSQPLLGGRLVPGACLFCHTNRTEDVPWSASQYPEPVFRNGHGIGCERCHGPGGEHIKGPGVGKAPGSDVDPTIVNPRHLAPRLREAVCLQCHLEGKARVVRRGRGRYDFRPGMPLEDFLVVFHDASETALDHLVNHAEQMVRGACYQKSAGPKQMGCISCHDPHEKPAPEQRVSHYRAACLKCHQETSCSLPKPKRLEQNKEDSCIACHMPRYSTSDIPHTASTDHRIWRKLPHREPGKTGTVKKIEAKALRSFFGESKQGSDPEMERDRTLALVQVVERGEMDRKALLEPLAAAAARDPSDLEVKLHYGLALCAANRSEEAVTVFQDMLTRAPQDEQALTGMAAACLFTNRFDESIGYYRRLIRLYPFEGLYRFRLIQVFGQLLMWEEAAEASRTWLKLDPGNAEARKLLSQSLQRLGKISEAREQNRVLEELHRR